MKSFQDFISLKENDGLSAPLNPMNPIANQLPPEQSVSPDASREMESLTNDIQRLLDRLFKTVAKHHLNKQKTMSLLQNIISTIAQQNDLPDSNIRQASHSALQQNSEPVQIGHQPQAT